ncbi:lysosomal proton-coupled steroid conjugate and bile acid symporter SLC46A3-like [Mytilus edulis]|uniref:MFS transporter, PCFT/HCP family, solute carrier family 46 (Folate transporter), member 1/3 n=1 Tax=Mytilus galloprovincialis TaxID=29158 RepID=A0A8B6F949_MYTGA|nr:MFS transporter, PCFT/HCP family, solute carrier family 46 (folate transporter), member 1/3 [Mytilus galloprovincialis]
MSLISRAHTKCMHWLSVIQPYLVEVAYFTFFLSRHMTLPLFQQYVKEEIEKQHKSTTPASINLTDTTKDALTHEEITLSVLSLQIAEGLPAVITVIMLGAISDKTGRRKILLWMPSLGSVLYSFIYIMIQYTGWNLDGLFMASALRGLSGSMTAFLAGGTFYAINSSNKENRSTRLGVQEFLNGIAYAIANIMVGYWVKSNGFLRPFWFTFICSCISFLISFFLVKEVEITQQNLVANRISSNQGSNNCCIDTFKPLSRFFKCCKNRKLIKVWLSIIAFQSYAIVHLGQINTLVLYFIGPPYQWDSDKFGVFAAVAMVVAAIGAAASPVILKPYLSDINITFIGLFSKAIGTMWIAVVKNETVLYFAILLLVGELLPFPMLRSVVSNSIETTDQGSLFALMHCGESISYFLAPLMFQAIYLHTFKFFSGFVFVISVTLLVIPVVFTIAIKYVEMNGPTEYERMSGENEGIETSQSYQQLQDQEETSQAISVISNTEVDV